MARKMKILGVTVSVVFLILVGLWAVLMMSHPDEKVFGFVRDSSGHWKIKFGKTEEAFLKNMAKKTEEIIYREATEHNPEGDFLPDGVDDAIKEEIKNRTSQSL
ncbi:MAG: hypothetical protein Q8L11_02560 [Candidatus Moranbacteria bacterium]|nr:hypothetical protein [Candidatus Moranbacteria bacterium]